MRAAVVALAVAWLSISCAKQASSPSIAHVEGESAPASSRTTARKLIRTVDLEIRVNNTEEASALAQSLVQEVGGYVSGVDAYLSDGLRHFRMTLKVPVADLEAAVVRLKALAVEVQREHLRTEDVTSQMIDLGARLRTLQATETELQALLAESRAREQKAEDIMAIYRHLTEIRTTIEQHQAKLANLENLTSFSTINLNLVPTEAARPLLGDKWRPSETVRSSFRSLLGALQALADFAIVLVIVVLPVLAIVIFPMWLVVKRWRRRRQNP